MTSCCSSRSTSRAFPTGFKAGKGTVQQWTWEGVIKPAVKGKGWTKAEISSFFPLRLLKWFSICTAVWNSYSLSAIFNPVENRHQGLQTAGSLFFQKENVTSLASPFLPPPTHLTPCSFSLKSTVTSSLYKYPESETDRSPYEGENMK